MRRTGLWLIAGILTLLLGACTDTPEFRRYHPMVSICGTSVERPPSGNLAQDMVGDWRTLGSGDHPLTGLGVGLGDRVYRFRADGTGHYWYAYESPGDQGGGEGTFTWSVEDGHLVVNDLPPAVVEVTPGAVYIRTMEDPDTNTGSLIWSRCEGGVPSDDEMP